MNLCNRIVQSLLGLLSVILIVPLAGCWSSKEIEDLGLVVGTSIDLKKEESLDRKVGEQEGSHLKRPLITITNQFVTSQGSGAGTNEGTSQQKSYKNVSETGDAITPILREMILKNEKRAFAEHEKVIVIGEDLARTVNLQQTLDFFLREQEIRSSCLVLISKSRAIKTLESKDPAVIPAFHLVQITKGQNRTTKILPPVPLGKIEGKMHSGSSFLLQNVISANGEVKFVGAAVIEGKTNKMRGFLNEKEVEGLTWITGKGKGGLVKSLDEKTGKPIIYEIESMKSDIQPHVVGNKISFDVKMESEGRIAENWVVSGNLFKNDYLKKVEKAIEKEVERLVKNVLNKTQQEYKVDVSGFGNRLRIEYPKEWKKVKKKWDQTFSKVPIRYDVKITIKDYGTSGSSK